MKLQSTCKCGSNIELQCEPSERVWAEFRFKEWQVAHEVCRNRVETNPLPPMWSMPYQPAGPSGLGQVMCKAED